MNEDIESILEKEDISNFDKDICMMTRREIFKHFRFKSSRKINPTKLLKNLVWQNYCWISSGKTPPVEGNLRSFWYSHTKPLLSRLRFDVGNKKYVLKLSDVFVELITKYRLFCYVDFGFFDAREHFRSIGKNNGNLILFIEKEGLYYNAKKIAEKYDATSIASKGFPNHITTEFFIRDMANNGLLREPVHIFGVVDYDPSGYWILKEFEKQLLGYGVEVASCHSLVTPEIVSNIEYNKFKLGKGHRVANWLEMTGGIDGESYGLEANALKSFEIRDVFEKSIQPYLAGSSQAFAPQTISKEKAAWLRWLC